MKKDEIIWLHLGLFAILLFVSRGIAIEVLMLVGGISSMFIKLTDILVTAIKTAKEN